MNIKEFMYNNSLNGISIQGGREKKLTMEDLLRKFQQPLIDMCEDFRDKIISKQKTMSKEPMSPMTEFQYKMEIIEMLSFIKKVNELTGEIVVDEKEF